MKFLWKTFSHLANFFWAKFASLRIVKRQQSKFVKISLSETICKIILSLKFPTYGIHVTVATNSPILATETIGTQLVHVYKGIIVTYFVSIIKVMCFKLYLSTTGLEKCLDWCKDGLGKLATCNHGDMFLS